ncbi:MAG TPA: DUF502 domain-containing protein [Steroidobacteraceae bacterium]
MDAIKNFLKATLVGGLLFLVPAVLLLVLMRHAMQFAGKIAEPIAAALPGSQSMGSAVITLVAVLVLLAIALIAGLIAKSPTGRRITAWFEESILGGLPQYRMVKSMAEGLAQIETGVGMKPVLVHIDEGWQLGYWIEDLQAGWVAVFVPQAPTPMSGNVMYVPSDHVQALDIAMPDAMRLVKHLGIGSSKVLRGARL